MKLLTIARNTFKEGIRARILYNLVFFAITMISFSYFLGQLSIGENYKVMVDFGLSAISLFGVLIAIFVGISLIYKEIDKRTIYTILSKPIRRWEFIVGKYFGLCGILLVQLVTTWVFFVILIYFYNRTFHSAWLLAMLFIYLELMVITAIATFFSSFSSPFLSALFTISFFVIGHTTDDLVGFANKTKNIGLINLAKAFNGFLNLKNFNITTEVVHGMPLTLNWVFYTICYAVAFVVLLLIISSLIFKQRDFK
jgi:ABC-type transport system involved in multi-copper enzyme maturation permease subunit